MESKIKEMTEKLSKLEGLAGGNDGHTLLQQHQKEMLAKLREIRAAMATETGELDSVKEANAEVAKLREVIKRRDYRILHLTRALEAGASSSADPGSA
ncbi:unnamed protein product [Ectocarpus sp. 12 AP-2014]